MPNFYRKFTKDWLLRQNPETGKFPNVAPNYHGGGGPGWPGIVAAMAWRNYLYYADRDLLTEAYQPMMDYLQFIETECEKGIYSGGADPWQCIGDWLAADRGMDSNRWPESEWNNFFNNCYRVLLWRTQQKAAAVLNKPADAASCQAHLDQIIPAIHAHYYNGSTARYVSDEQSYLLMPLVAQIVPQHLREDLHSKLIATLERDGSIRTGMLGTYFLIQYLQENDQNDLLYRLIAHTNYPGWGYMLSQGATTWWEQWNGYWSQIHSCFTSLDGWFYQGLAGIRPSESGPGMKEFRIKPTFISELSYVNASTESLYGTIKSSWKRKEDKIILEVEVPTNTTAEVSLPEGYVMEKEGNFINQIRLPGGKYHFQISMFVD